MDEGWEWRVAFGWKALRNDPNKPTSCSNIVVGMQRRNIILDDIEFEHEQILFFLKGRRLQIVYTN